MTSIVTSELNEGMISRAQESPHCCSVNYYVNSLIKRFHYLSLDDVTDHLQPHDYMAVVDIKLAYRAVLIHPSQRKFVGFKWEVNGETCEFVLLQ